MSRLRFVPVLALLYACQASSSTNAPPSTKVGSAAESARCDAGVDDPFRHLERLDDPEVRAWMRAHTEAARASLDAIPGLDELARDLAVLDGEGDGAPSFHRSLPSGVTLELRGDGDGGHERLYVVEPGGDARVLFDPGAFVISYLQPSWSGEQLVVSVTRDGEEIGHMLVLAVDDGRQLVEPIHNVWPADSGGVSWLPDDSGFVYLYYPITDPRDPGFLHDMEAVLYRLDARAGPREVVLSAAHDPKLGIERHDFPMVFVPNQDSEYAVALIGGAAPHAASYIAPIDELVAGEPCWRPLFGTEDKVAHFAIVGEHVDVLSARRRPEYEILRVPLAAPELDQAQLLAAPPRGAVITASVTRGDEQLFVRSRDGVVATLHHRDASGAIIDVELPGSFGDLTLEAGLQVPGSRIDADARAELLGGGWLNPMRAYTYDFDTREFAPERGGDPGVAAGVDALIVEEHTVIAHDGVEIPLSIIRRGDLPRDGARPTLIYGYGAYGLSATPYYYAPFLAWAQRGGIVAIAHVRGGGEKGESWHLGGYKATKPNTWRDAIACAQALQSDAGELGGFTSPEHTVIWGLSAGGVMVGRALTEQPELFTAAIAEVAMLNPARIEVTANGDNSSKEFGSLDEPDECEALLDMDAYLHVRDEARYPAVLVTAGINDPRVDTWEANKFAARLEQANAGVGEGGPTLLWIDYEGGHGMAEAPEAVYPKLARILGFGLWRAGHPDFQPQG